MVGKWSVALSIPVRVYAMHEMKSSTFFYVEQRVAKPWKQTMTNGSDVATEFSVVTCPSRLACI